MKVGIPKEISPGETRVALIPGDLALLVKQNHEFFIEEGAGEASLFSDSQYEDSGAHLVVDLESVYREADIVLKVNPPEVDSATGKREAELMREGTAFMGFLAPHSNQTTIRLFVKRRILSFSMEYIPRITRAQSMDALSSMATISGYKAILMAAERLRKMFPLMMTAAGTVAPAGVLVLGAGVAGLQAIATAKRLGARVEAFDPRPVVKEQVESLGATFVEMDLLEDAETSGGYAKQQSQDFLEMERGVIGARLPKVDVVVCTAQIFGARAPLLITSEMMDRIRPGSVIVDLAAGQGGNCKWTEAGQTVEKQGITIIGAKNLAPLVPIHASQLYSKNISNLFRHVFGDGEKPPDFEDEITRGACLTRDGEIVNEKVKQLLGGEE